MSLADIYTVHTPNDLQEILELLGFDLEALGWTGSDDEPESKKLKLDDDSKNDDKKEDDQIDPTSHKEQLLDLKNEPLKEKTKSSKSEDAQSEESDECRERSDTDSDTEDEGPAFNYPIETDSSDMLDEYNEIYGSTYPNVTDRYFTPYYQLDIQRPGDDICIRIHSNRICMISLAPSHFLLQGDESIESITFKVSEKLDRLQNKVSGKAKHGAQPLQANSNLCRIVSNKGNKYTVKCCMIGKLIEVNERIVKDPEILKKEPHQGAYIAIVLPNLRHHEKLKESLLNKEQYQEALRKRAEKANEEKKQDPIIEDSEKKSSQEDVNLAKDEKVKDEIKLNELEAQINKQDPDNIGNENNN